MRLDQEQSTRDGLLGIVRNACSIMVHYRFGDFLEAVLVLA
jgi:hypothetical protein